MNGGESSRIVMVPTAGDAPPAAPGTIVVVLDTAWTPQPGDRGDLLPVRRIVSQVLDSSDLFEDALALLDAWADAAELPARLRLGEFSIWYAVREQAWHWLHERLLWRAVVAALVPHAGPVRLVIVSDDPALIDVMHGMEAIGVDVEIRAPAPSPSALGSATSRMSSLSGRIARFVDSRVERRRKGRSARRKRIVNERLRTIANGPRDRVLVLSYTAIHQRIDGRSNHRFVDPNLASVIERLRRDGPDPIIIGLGLDHRIDQHWAQIAADAQLLPQSLLETRWRGNDTSDPASIDSMVGVLRDLDVPLDLDGIDLRPALVARIRAFTEAWLPPTQMLAARVRTLIEELRPRALVLTHEGIRAAWVVAARRAGVPTFAVQHGMLYPTHPGYCHARDPSVILPDVTFVYGPYERDVLLQHGGYRLDEVAVSGSPRIDLDAANRLERRLEAERRSVRREIGVRGGDRMLVVSTAHAPIVRRFHLVDMIEKTLGGPLPGIHVVFKQHPAEVDEGPYRALLTGLASAGGYEPPTVSVVRDTDLYRLLRACDAHLGFHSTVLTDAVIVGVPNLVAIVQSFGDLLGYVAAGVARPVGSVEELREAIRNPAKADPAARRAFLEDHFLPGDAGARIVARIQTALATEESPKESVSATSYPGVTD